MYTEKMRRSHERRGMTRRDYELIANTLREARPPDGEKAQGLQWHWTVNRFAHALKAANERFDVARFRQACGMADP